MMRLPRRFVIAISLMVLVVPSCSDAGELGGETTVLDYGRSAEWVAGGGGSHNATLADRSIELGTDDDLPTQIVANDGALWVMSQGDVGSCAAMPERRQDDRVSRIAPDGQIRDVDFSFVDTSDISGASSGDCPTVVSGPVSVGDGAVLVTVSSQVNYPGYRQWWRTYRISADGEPELWEPVLPEGFGVVGLGRSASGEVLVIGGYRITLDVPGSSKTWDQAWGRSSPLGVDGYRLFAVDPVTMQSRTIGVEPRDSGSRIASEPATMWMTGNLPFSDSLALLSDGRLAYWTNTDGLCGLWIEGADGVMKQLVDANSEKVDTAQSSSGPTGSTLNSIQDLAGGWGGAIAPGPDGNLLVTVWSSKVTALDIDKYRVKVENVPPNNSAQSIIDENTPPQGVSGMTVLLGPQATRGDSAAIFTIVDVSESSRCIWDGGGIICGSDRFVSTESGAWFDWVYYRLPPLAP